MQVQRAAVLYWCSHFLPCFQITLGGRKSLMSNHLFTKIHCFLLAEGNLCLESHTKSWSVYERPHSFKTVTVKTLGRIGAVQGREGHGLMHLVIWTWSTLQSHHGHLCLHCASGARWCSAEDHRGLAEADLSRGHGAGLSAPWLLLLWSDWTPLSICGL